MTTGAYADVASRLAEATGVLLSLDFDGTLAPIADDPDAPTITPAARRAVSRFVGSPRATVAVISGRELADLWPRVGLDGIVYVGNHGLELARGDESVIHPAADRCRPRLRRALDRIRERLAEVPGWQLEDKGVTATVHVRHTPASRVGEVRSAVEAAARTAEGELRLTAGKQVFELRPAVDWDKGTAVRFLSDEVPDGWVTVCLGDDVTDEDAFQAVLLDGIAVHVGSHRQTAAPYRLPAQDAVAPFLEWVADRALAPHGTPQGGATPTDPHPRLESLVHSYPGRDEESQ